MKVDKFRMAVHRERVVAASRRVRQLKKAKRLADERADAATQKCVELNMAIERAESELRMEQAADPRRAQLRGVA